MDDINTYYSFNNIISKSTRVKHKTLANKKFYTKHKAE